MALFGRASNALSSFHRGEDRPPYEGLYIYLVTVMVGYLVADLTILKIRPIMLPTQAPPAYTPPQQDYNVVSRTDYNVISNRNLFNADGVIPPALSTEDKGGQQVEDAAPVLSQLPLKLEGTIVHLNPVRSVATINVQAKNETLAFMLEDDIAGLAKVTKIERRRVIFRNLNNNRLEYIEIPKDSLITFGLKNQEVAGDSEVKAQGEFQFSMRRDDLNKYLSDLPSILTQARMLPNILPGSGGQVDGFRFVSIQPNSIYEKLGFKVGDVIKGVNGDNVNSPSKAMELFNSLRNDNRIELSVERNGKLENFNYEVNE